MTSALRTVLHGRIHSPNSRSWSPAQVGYPRPMGEPISWRTDLEIDPVVEAYKQHVDRSLIRENLRRSVEERFRRLIELQGFAVELRRAGRAASRR